MTNFAKMKYLHRNTVKKQAAGSGAGEAEKKTARTSRAKKAQKGGGVPPSGEGKGAGDEECSGDTPEDIPG